MTEDRFIFTSSAQRKIFITIGIGILLLAIGVFMLSMGGHGAEHGAHGEVAGHGGEHGHGAPHWSMRLIKDLWLNNVYFTGIAVIGVFFMAFNYVAQAGWSAYLKRVPEAFGYYLPVAAVLMIVSYFLFNHEIFHWTHHDLYIEKLPNGQPNPEYDEIIAGKAGYLNQPFFIVRMLAYFGLWILVWWNLRKNSTAEDLDADLVHHNNSIFWSALFLIIFGITSSTSAWDWVLSIDTHFFSTMFGWYVFASWFISGLATITLIVVTLKENGYLPLVNAGHLHDLGKYLFAFSIFWTYIWFAQFLLIYYANIPEESVYFVERLKNDVYTPIFFMNFIINFFFPFLVLMTRDAKRQGIILKVVCVAILLGHWIDFYMMMTPALLKDSGGLDVKFFFVELGMTLIYWGIFFFCILRGLAKAPMVARNHPMLQESIHHQVY